MLEGVETTNVARVDADLEPGGSDGGGGAHAGDSVSAVIDLVDATGRVDASGLESLRERARAATGVLGCGGEVRVRVVGDAEMAAAHVRYSGIEGTTDVLTFDLAEGASAEGAPLDVDILICIDEAERRGAEMGHATERELLLYIVHGVLHCLGHDDHDEAEYARMHALEDEVLAAIGVGATFDPQKKGTR